MSPNFRIKLLPAAMVLSMATVSACSASSIVGRADSAKLVIVPGAANPNLAGQPGGVSCCDGDSSPGQSPVLAASGFAAGSTFTFSATGTADGAGTGATGSDGAYPFNMTEYGLGVAPANGVGTLGLVGVFLGNSTPSGSSEPGRIDFSRDLNFASLSPGLKQIFWIGDGRTKGGAVQRFISPAGATRLYLGTADGTEWNNNTGSYKVTIRVLSRKL
jgi:hypothetical protein